MKWYAIVTLVVTAIALMTGLTVLNKVSNKNAMLYEYELLMAGQWEELSNCQDQLGVFYVEPGKEMKWEK